MKKLVHMQVHSFTMGDVEDPEIYVAHPILEWEKTEMGKWVMENGIEPTFSIGADMNYGYGYRVVIRCKFTEEDATFFSLKYK